MIKNFKKNVDYSLCILFCLLFTVIFSPNQARSEGFAMIEWGARGIGLAGGMVARADDASALAYNAAGITQISGTSIMFGGSAVTPYGKIVGTRADGSKAENHATAVTWMPAHGYASYQLNDDVWLGIGLFSRFGLGNGYDENWFGRYNAYQISLQTVSAVPTIAYKFNDIFSASIGLDIMYVKMNQKNRIPDLGSTGIRENSVSIEGTGAGVGVHLGLHAKFNEQWSAGLAYKSAVTQRIKGKAEFDYQGRNNINNMNMVNSDVHGTLKMPDSVSFAVAYKPIEDLSIEVGTVWTRWSNFKALNIYFENPSGYNSISNKEWTDGWNFNASIEYKALSWLTLRAGYWYETAVASSQYADFSLPVSGRDVITVGVGFNWDSWVLDLAYGHIWSHSADYSNSRAAGVPGTGIPGVPGGDIVNAKSQDMRTNIFVVSLGYTF